MLVVTIPLSNITMGKKQRTFSTEEQMVVDLHISDNGKNNTQVVKNTIKYN